MPRSDGYIQFERQVLSVAMQGEDLQAFMSLPGDAWSRQNHTDIHQSICRVYLDRGSVDELEVFKDLTENDIQHTTLEDLFRLTQEWLTFGMLPKLCNELAEAANHRRVVTVVQEAMALAKDASNARDAKKTALGRILSLDDVSSDEKIFPMSVSLNTVFEESKAMFQMTPEEREASQGITSGLRSLDQLTEGWQPGSVYILAAGTGRGKSVLGLQFAMAAVSAGRKALYCSLEMSHVDLARRALAAEARVSPTDIKAGALTEDQINRMVAATRTLAANQENFAIYDQAALSLFQLAATVRQMRQAGGLDLLVVDYIQLLRTDQTYSREREVATISAGLVAIARTNEIPVIALSQMNETGSIRESRAVEHDAAGILKIEYEDGAWVTGSGPVECGLVLAKHRHGRTGRVDLTFERAHQRFNERIYF